MSERKIGVWLSGRVRPKLTIAALVRCPPYCLVIRRSYSAILTLTLNFVNLTNCLQYEYIGLNVRFINQISS